MANRKFTEQEMLTLRNSKYVLDVSPSIVHFSAEFKNCFGRNCRGTSLHVSLSLSLGHDLLCFGIEWEWSENHDWK